MLWMHRSFFEDIRLKVMCMTFMIVVQCIHGIVNPNQETANSFMDMSRMTSKFGPKTWNSGIECVKAAGLTLFHKREALTRASNIILTNSKNMSTPAAQIQDGIIEFINEAILLQVRIISDGESYTPDDSSRDRELALADFYIIVVDNLNRLRRLMRQYVSRMSSWNPGGRFLILYFNPSSLKLSTDKTKEIFQELLEEYYINRVALFYAVDRLKYNLLFMDYFSDEECRELRVRKVGSCSQGEWEPSRWLIDNITKQYFDSMSLKNCTFFLCASVAAPFIEADCVTGLELRVISFIKNRYQFAVDATCERENRGVQEAYGNWSGLLGKLEQRNCDFIMGGFYPDNDVAEAFWTTDTYFDDSHTFFVKIADPMPLWLALYSIFDNLIWLSIFGVLLITWLASYVTTSLLPEPKSSKEFSLIGLNVLGVTINAAINERPIFAATRIFLMALSLYAMNIVAIYTSKMIEVFGNPGRLHQMETIQEVVDAGIPIGGPEESADWFENDDDMWLRELYNRTSAFIPNSMNLPFVKSGERVILSSRMYVMQNPISDALHAFPTNVFSSPVQMIMKSGFPFIYDFNLIIRVMRDAGIFKKLKSDFVYNNTYLNRISKMRPQFLESTIVITIEHMQGPFAILICGIIGSIVLFIGELLIYWCLGSCMKRCFGLQIGHVKRAKLRKEQKKKAKRAAKKAKLSDDDEEHKRRVKRPKPTNSANNPKNNHVRNAAKKINNNNNNGGKIKPKGNKEIPLIYNSFPTTIQSIRFTPVKRRYINLNDFK